MFKHIITATILALAPLSLQAATINLTDLDLIPQTPVYAGGGDLTFENGRIPILSDNTNVTLDGFADSQLLLSFVGAASNSNLVSISYDTNNAEQFDVTALGDNGDDMFELLLERSSFNLSSASVGLGPNAIIRFTSDEFDFTQDAPFDFFATSNLVDYTGVRFAATSLFAEPMPTVPLSPAALFMITGLAGLGWVGRRRKARA